MVDDTKTEKQVRICSRFFVQVWHENIPIGNIGFPNGPVFRYGNFFIPRVEKSSKISPRAKNLVLQRAVGPREARFFSQCWDEEISIPENRPIRKSYISIRCLHGFMSNLIKKSWTDSSTGCFNSKPDVLKWSCDLHSELLVF